MHHSEPTIDLKPIYLDPPLGTGTGFSFDNGTMSLVPVNVG
jgi:hypothetical protein